MLTIDELARLINKAPTTIRYWFKIDKEFRHRFWTQKEVLLKDSRGLSSIRKLYLCNETDADKIVEYIAEKKRAKKLKPHWSNIAIHCWERQMTCDGCCFQKYCGKFTNPPMKTLVKNLVEKYGEPR